MAFRHPLTGTILSLAVIACAPEQTLPDRTATQTEPAAEMPRTEIRDEGPGEHLVYRPADIDWQPGPASLEEGAEHAVLEGDPSEPGVFTMRIRMPDGFRIAPHWHPNVERVTVLSGTFLLGTGESPDRGAAMRLEAGSHTSMPPETRHYVFIEGATEIQLTSVGPWEIHYVNPGDDPRQRRR